MTDIDREDITSLIGRRVVDIKRGKNGSIRIIFNNAMEIHVFETDMFDADGMRFDTTFVRDDRLEKK